MEKEFIEYKQALKLTKLGFNEFCFGYCVDSVLDLITTDINDYPPLYVEVIKAPLYQQAFRWFREKYNLEVSFYRTMETIEGLKYGYQIERWESETTEDLVNLYEKSYEEAELACLKKLIEIVKLK